MSNISVRDIIAGMEIRGELSYRAINRKESSSGYGLGGGIGVGNASLYPGNEYLTYMVSYVVDGVPIFSASSESSYEVSEYYLLKSMIKFAVESKTENV